MKRFPLLFFLLLPFLLSGQNRWEGGLLSGGSFYQGDLTPSAASTIREVRPAYGLLLRRNMGQQFSLRANVLRGTLSGDDANYKDFAGRALSFSTRFTELSLLLEWRLAPATGSRLEPYFFAGGGWLQIAPRPEFLNQPGGTPPKGVKEDIQADYARSRFALPFGFGLEYSLNERWALGAEGGLRTAFTDYLDGISQAGNPEKKDWFGFLGVTIAYRWGTPDQDGDGIADARDNCPALAGTAIHNGCPDTDSDGIADQEDDCPLLAGPIRGCPDSDGDGIADHIDQCPDTPGPAFRAGCPSDDSDGDGIPDKEDRCPHQVGPPARQGCPLLDSDQDGIEDDRDQCPLIPGSSANAGCPEVVGDSEASYRLLFEPYDTGLDEQHRLLLNALAAALARQPAAFLLIKGHADEQDTAGGNQQLSLRRARACYQYLLQRGAPSRQMHFDGYGDNYLLAPAGSDAGRHLNRRVELELQLQ